MTNLLDFSNGVLSGVTGIVTQPIQGAYQEGISGFVKGVGIGMIGVITKPVASTMSLVAHTSHRYFNILFLIFYFYF